MSVFIFLLCLPVGYWLLATVSSIGRGNKKYNANVENAKETTIY
jgi:hypothetical protein